MQSCCLAKQGKKQPEQLRNQNDSEFAILVRVRLGFSFAEATQVSIRFYLHRAEPGRFRLGKSQSTGSESVKTVNSHGCAELPTEPLIDAHSCRFGSQGGRTCIGLGSNEAAGQITGLVLRSHRFSSFLIRYDSPLTGGVCGNDSLKLLWRAG